MTFRPLPAPSCLPPSARCRPEGLRAGWRGRFLWWCSGRDTGTRRLLWPVAHWLACLWPIRIELNEKGGEEHG
jgi:hypothetical protein